MLTERPIASIHIPRTGGSSVRKFWLDLYGSDKAWLYSIDTGGFHRAAEDGIFNRANPALYFIRDILATSRLSGLYRLINQTAHQRREAKKSVDLPPDFRVVHGHFSPDFIMSKIGDVRLVTVIRDPLERTLSGYFFLRNLEPVEDKRMPPWYRRGMSFEEFAFLDEMINYQTKFLADHDLSIFDLVGTTNQLECFCRFFDPRGTVGVSRLNSSNRPEIRLSEDFLSRFKDKYSPDYNLYEVAQQRVLKIGNVSFQPALQFAQAKA